MAEEVLWKGSPRIKGWTESQRMAMLTFSLIGLQFTWDFTPHLLELGLAKSQTSLVWIAPPLSGLIVQPIIGTVSDSSTLRWGRRRPYILICSILVAIGLCSLAWSFEIVGSFTGDKETAKKLSVAMAIACIYAVDFAINAVQATARCLIVDTLAESQQQLGSAWAGRMLGLGHVLGYLIGTVDLMKYFGGSLGDTQFKQICLIASVTIIVCCSLTCYCVEERVLLSKRVNEGCSSALSLVSTVFTTALHLPKKIQAVCWITFWSWIGWSPFFVYGTTWVGETYYRQDATTALELKTSKDVAGDIARKGSLALVLFSLISFTGSIILPWMVESPAEETTQSEGADARRSTPGRSPLKRYQMSITTAWGLSQMAFGSSMILAPFSRPWAMYGWAPLAILGEEINKLENSSHDPAYSSIEQDPSVELTSLRAESNEFTGVTTSHGKEEATSATAGIYLGIWNIFATIPQFLATFIAAIAFSIIEPGKSPELAKGDNERGNNSSKGQIPGLTGTAVCLAIGAVCSFVAAAQTFRLPRTSK
ncbi:MAG: hypothetical protein M1835_000441 [Candelina submexicana]|nr:MAG: hypothetical protein M1835_000441 [Candelina submexicana]